MNTNKEMNGSGLILREEVFAIVGAAMEVHSEMGAGFLEAVYQEAMEIEMARRSIPFKAQYDLFIRYKDHQLQKTYCADFLCYDQVIVEIKSMKELTGREEARLLNYLKATGCRVGLLINFGDPSRLEWKRFVH